jgi:quercetin dioxygenase-like cupin family protein
MHVFNRDAKETEVSRDVSRKLLGHGDSLMLVEVRFKEGGVGEPHSHDTHEQVSYIAKGAFNVTLGAQKLTLRQGDSFYAAKNVLHGVIALEDDSVIVDVFTPIREEFL